ncbi:MAG: hypothetical protein ACRYFW_11045 [Janthinobacterium lividum]
MTSAHVVTLAACMALLALLAGLVALARMCVAAAPFRSPHPDSDPVLVARSDTMLKTFIIEAEEIVLKTIKAAGAVLKSFVVTETQKLVAETKMLPIGTTP